ncbi:MAG: hypothetical protein WC688_02875 [Parachlamydiales bacterium]|jgi:hypothetical protein
MLFIGKIFNFEEVLSKIDFLEFFNEMLKNDGKKKADNFQPEKFFPSSQRDTNDPEEKRMETLKASSFIWF